ncbi:MAG TPA: glutamate synthase large subunit [Phycisphaerae bacterium]|nr:glutamate synthase large subunit [Phycisphaerae bacterium]
MHRPPRQQGLYDPRNERDACGIGAVVNIDGHRSHQIVRQAREVLLNLHHRGAAGADNATGDGAGILMQMPHEFIATKAKELKIKNLPEETYYACGNVFLPKDPSLRSEMEEMFKITMEHYGLCVMGWRDLNVNPDCLGQIAKDSEPCVRQVLVNGNGLHDEALECKLYVARKQAEKSILAKFGELAEEFYICSLSCRTLNYKGMFLARQLFDYYADLSDESMKTAIALVHQRYSTNTFPSWKLAQPFRAVAHNGEINTISGNRQRMKIREQLMESPQLCADFDEIRPVLTEGMSDSASFDEAFELFVRAGRSAPHAVMMMMPEAFGASHHMSTDKRAFYEYHAALMEPWDGPAAMAFTDGRLFGATLDRNGLRPCRWVITTDNVVVLASEVGVIEFPPEKISSKGRLRPGNLFLVDTQEQRIISDSEIKSKIARSKPYRRWLEENRIELRGLFDAANQPIVEHQSLLKRMRAFGVTREELQTVIQPMAANGQEAVGSMGNDTPLAVLSEKPKLLFNYFRQLFAQVTNPPIDPLREGTVMSLMLFMGRRRNILLETPEHCKQIKIPHPILTNEDMQRLRSVKHKDVKVTTISSLFEVGSGDATANMQAALDRLVNDAEKAIDEGATILIISDRGMNEHLAAIPALLAASAVHRGLYRRRKRGKAGLVVESGEVREVMHFCLLCGYGVNAINPYLAFEMLAELKAQDNVPANLDIVALVDNYIAAIKKGMLKTMSKMGISTLRSYRSAQIFEAIGISKEVIDKYFTGTTSRIGGIGLEKITADAVARHNDAFRTRKPGELELNYGGEYHYRFDGEKHLTRPEAIISLHQAVRNNDRNAYERYSKSVNDQTKAHCTLRGLFKFRPGNPVPLDEVEPACEIVKRFCTGAMSHGSISKEAHECMAIAMNRIGAMSNTGEGGEDPARYVLDPNGDDRNCRIKQVASARFGVTINYLAHAKEIQIKMAQGAKPGEGGQLPGYKVTEEIARLRHSTPGVTLISPPPHHDIYSIEDLAQLIYDLKCSNPGVKVSIKLVSEVGVGTIAAGVAKGNADEVLISGHDGGTGASPLSSIKYAGGPWELGLAETQQVLVLNRLRGRIRVQTDGQLKTGRDVAIATLLGAEQYGFGTTSLLALGCVMMRKCHLGTCPVGIATQQLGLRKNFTGKPEHLIRFMFFIAEEMREIMAELGFRKVEDMIGRVDMLDVDGAVDFYKQRGLDFSQIFHAVDCSDGRAVRKVTVQENKLADHLDWKIIEMLGDKLEKGQPTSVDLHIRNVNRTVGTILSNRVIKKFGENGLPDNTITINLNGTAGQSLGAFLAAGITINLVGDANDYVGKGLSGGRIAIKTPPNSPFVAHQNIIAGNTLLYGATEGEVFINGVVGERFCVRNSGAVAVVEGCGDHGCEYMTGGITVILGQTGRNFAAGMSGGVAFVLDELQLFDTLCNLDMVDLEPVHTDEDENLLKRLISDHYKWTGSSRAKWILDRWRDMVGRFVKVMPIDYRHALERMKQTDSRGTETTPATEEVFNG